MVTTGLLARGISTGYSLLAVSYASSFMDQRLIGLWLVAISLVVALPLLDLGAGSALTNIAARAIAAENSESARGKISVGLAVSFLLAFGVCLAVCCLIVLARHYLSFEETAILMEDDFYSALLGMLAVAPFLVVSATCAKVFTALEQVHIANIISALLGTASIFLLLLIKAVGYRCTVFSMTLLTILPQCLGIFPATIILSQKGFLSFRACINDFWKAGKAMVSTGSIFFLLQIGVIVGWGSDSILIGSLVGPELVASFALPLKLLQTATMPVTMYNQPLWGTFALATARNKSAEIASILKRTVLTTAVSSGVIVLLVFIFMEPLISIWTKGTVVYLWPVGFLLAIWVIMDATGNCFSMYLNGCGILRPQVYSVVSFCFLSISLKFMLAPNFGLMGMVFSTIVAYLISVPFIYLVLCRREVLYPIVVHK